MVQNPSNGAPIYSRSCLGSTGPIGMVNYAWLMEYSPRSDICDGTKLSRACQGGLELNEYLCDHMWWGSSLQPQPSSIKACCSH